MPAATTRQEIHVALFELLEAAYPWVTAARAAQDPTKVPSEQQPAMFLIYGKEHLQRNRSGLPYKSQLLFRAWLLSNTGSTGGSTDDGPTIPADLMTPLVDAVVNALKPTAAGTRNTLGGLVYDAFVDGELIGDEGLLAPQSVVVVPVVVLTADL